MPRTSILRVGALLALVLLVGCTDAATRVAFDLEQGAARLRSSGASHVVVKHVPRRFFDGCSGDYQIQLSQASSLLVWCRDRHGEIVSSHATTYHLNFVKVPRTWVLQKRDGQPTWIELAPQGADVVVARVY